MSVENQNAVTGESVVLERPLAAIEQDEARIILELDEREAQYGQELKLTEALLACRADLSRQAEIAGLQQQLREVQQGNPLLGLDVDARTVATPIKPAMCSPAIASWTAGYPMESIS